MSQPRKFEIDERQLVALAHAFNTLKPLFDLALTDEDTAGICALDSCKLPFIKREVKQRFCCPAHQVKYSNEQRKYKKMQDFVVASEETVKCQVVGCDKTFMLDMSVPYPYRCRECAAKSI